MFGIGDLGGTIPRSGLSISSGSGRPCSMAMLCRMQQANIIVQTLSGLYNSVHPDVSKHRQHPFKIPFVRSITDQVFACASLYASSCRLWGFIKGVISHGVRG